MRTVFAHCWTLQNWQSEFLAVATLAAFSIYLPARLGGVKTRGRAP